MNENAEVITDAVTGEVTIREMGAEEIAARAEARMAILRGDAKLTKAQFIIRCKRAAILSVEDALMAAKGDMPTAFLDAITAAGGDANEAQIVWASVAEVWRLDPYVQILAALPNIGEAVADQLFGIE